MIAGTWNKLVNPLSLLMKNLKNTKLARNQKQKETAKLRFAISKGKV